LPVTAACRKASRWRPWRSRSPETRQPDPDL
jgi:hypothetical protein